MPSAAVSEATLLSSTRWRSRVRVAVVVVSGIVSLWLLRSVLTEVYSELGDVRYVDVRWLVAIVGAEAVTFVATWEMNRLALRTDRWSDIAVAQLAGNAANNVVPAGGPVGAAVQLRVLSDAGFEITKAATSLGALSILSVIGLLSLPVIALPIALTDAANRSLRPELWAGAGLLAVTLVGGATLLSRDGLLARLVNAVQSTHNVLRAPRHRRTDLVPRVLEERNSIRAEFGRRPIVLAVATVAKPGGDCLALYLCLVAVGTHPNAVTVLVAFAAANVAGMVPLTPGGLGFVEAGLTGILVAAGINAESAALAVGLYRLASTWLPVTVGAVSYSIFRTRPRTRQHHRPVDAGSDGDLPGALTGVTHVEPVGATTASATVPRWRRPLVAATTVIALVLVAPILIRVYRRLPDVAAVGPGWLTAIVVVITLHFVAAWALYRVVLRTTGWFDVAASQLASNAVSHVAPAGSAVGAGLQLRMLTMAGFPASQATTALGATTILGTVAGYVVLPIVVIVVSTRGTLEPRLVHAMWFSAAVLTVALATAVALAVRDTPWRWIARAVTAVRRRNATGVDALTVRLLRERDLLRGTLHEHVGVILLAALAQPLADYAALYLALQAAGAHVSAAAALAAFIVSNVAGLIPFTPGGLGFVEAGLVGVLVIAGATRPEARLAVVTYRLAATWLPVLAGSIAAGAFYRRHRQTTSAPPDTAPP